MHNFSASNTSSSSSIHAHASLTPGCRHPSSFTFINTLDTKECTSLSNVICEFSWRLRYHRNRRLSYWLCILIVNTQMNGPHLYLCAARIILQRTNSWKSCCNPCCSRGFQINQRWDYVSGRDVIGFRNMYDGLELVISSCVFFGVLLLLFQKNVVQ